MKSRKLERNRLRQQNSSLHAQVSALALELRKCRRIDAEMRALAAEQKVALMELQASIRNEVQQPQPQLCNWSVQVIPHDGDRNLPTINDHELISEHYYAFDMCLD